MQLPYVILVICEVYVDIFMILIARVLICSMVILSLPSSFFLSLTGSIASDLKLEMD